MHSVRKLVIVSCISVGASKSVIILQNHQPVIVLYNFAEARAGDELTYSSRSERLVILPLARPDRLAQLCLGRRQRSVLFFDEELVVRTPTAVRQVVSHH